MEAVVEDDEPHADVQKAQAHHCEAHDRAGGERHVEALVQALVGGVGSAGVGAGGDFHAHEAGQSGVEPAGDEGEGHEGGDELHHRQYRQNDDHDDEELDDGGVLALEIGVRALADGGSNLFHQVGAL